MQTNRLNCLQILLKRRYDQCHLLIHLGKGGKVRHYLWDKHVNEEGETLQDLGKSWSICCWRPLRTGQACIYEEWSWQGGSYCGQRNNLHFLRLFLVLLPAQTWTLILCYDLYPVCHPQLDLSLHSLILLQEHICQLLPDHWKPLQLAATCVSLVPFSFSFLLHFTSSNSLQSSILSWTWHPAWPLSANRSLRGWQMSPFMVELVPWTWIWNIYSQVFESLLQTVCIFTPALVTFG